MTASIVWIDGQGHYTNVLDKWGIKSTVAPTVGNYGRFDKGLAFTQNDACFVQTSDGQIPTAQDWSLGFWLKMPVLGNTAGLFLLWDNVAGTTHLSCYVDSGGQIHVRRGSGTATEIADSGSNLFSANTWYYVEIKLRIHDSAGYVRIRVNVGTEWLVLTGADTQNGGTATANQMRIGNTDLSAYQTYYISDIWMINGADADYLGLRRVLTDFPNGEGSNFGWTPSAGDNFDCVNESVPDTGDYVTATDTSKKDTYLFPDLEQPIGSISAVALNLYAKKDDVNPRALGGLVSLSGVEDVSSGTNLTETYAPYQRIFPLDPNDAEWDATKVNAAECGVRLTG